MGKRGLGLLMAAVIPVGMGASSAWAQSYGGQSGTLHASSSAVGAGGRVTLSGAGFAPGSTVNVTLESTAVGLASATADASGSFTNTVTIPPSTPAGPHTILAVGQAAQGGTLTLISVITVGTHGAVAFTGSGNAIPLSLTGVFLVTLGLMVVVTVRRRRTPKRTTAPG